MNFDNIIKRVKMVLISPIKEWEVIRLESRAVRDIFLNYAAIVAALPALAGMIGLLISVRQALNLILVRVIIWGIVYYALSLVMAYGLALIIDALAPTFGAEKGLGGSVKIAVYSLTVLWVVQVLSIIPDLGRFAIWIGLMYTFFQIGISLQKIKVVPHDKLFPYQITLSIALIVLIYLRDIMTNGIALGSFVFRGF